MAGNFEWLLEYISDLEWFVQKMCSCCDTAVISYIPIEILSDFSIRQHEGWRNNCMIVQIIRMFEKNGFTVIDERRCIGNDLIMKFVRT